MAMNGNGNGVAYGGYTQQIKKLLGRRKSVPRGTYTTIAETLGCTRELVRQVADKRDVSLTSVAAEKRRCSKRGCENKIRMSSKTGLCLTHIRERGVVVLKCKTCKTLFPRSRAVHERYKAADRARPAYGPVCSHACRTRGRKVSFPCAYCGLPTTLRWISQYRNRLTFHRECRSKLPINFKNLSIVSTRLLPMQDHVEGIRRKLLRSKNGAASAVITA